jgi:DNA-directed RNA polymerase specialized sigma24 family protein
VPGAERPRAAALVAVAAAVVAVDREVAALVAPLDRAQVTTALLQEVAALQRHVAALRMSAVAELRGLGWSYRTIGAALGLSANAVSQIEKQRLRTLPPPSQG